MPEIVGLLCSYKTNNLHIFRTETFYHLNPKLPLTSNATTRKSINILTPSMPPIDFPNQIIARDVPELEIADLSIQVSVFRFQDLEFSRKAIKNDSLSTTFYWLLATGLFDLGCDLFPDGSFECCNVDFTGEMNRALSVDGIPTRWIC
jgi:hypothetical protein